MHGEVKVYDCTLGRQFRRPLKGQLAFRGTTSPVVKHVEYEQSESNLCSRHWYICETNSPQAFILIVRRSDSDKI